MSGVTHGAPPHSGRAEPDTRQDPKDEAKTPGAGPHAKPELTNPDATPGAGSLPDDGETGDDAGAG
ncbi:hypothetical protein [Aureimonas phyllosphaerae]|uniref:Uncharacterized protein n=1 Tax=Aureimonas phyllosphaerae TaxID=1166078 RepID=A0A7W6C0I4_9HYPH|nr:hypothetical protein [Aureimonas phyllosphaerae]MBB3937151.1 hypothetical protein [Aureimonas phyllosphaerae]MBB3961212.1 hypothetical protein [Aureimonas phyllosphaerae]SFF52297.1 hypothetical protein SAMN05216566_12145 [Aureimonas phyllosphaerae]